jgi:hypothetical protein
MVLTTTSVEQPCCPYSIAGNASEVNLYDITFCITVEIKSTSDCRSITSFVSGYHLTKKIRLQGKVPDGVEISIAFGLFLYSELYAA